MALSVWRCAFIGFGLHVTSLDTAAEPAVFVDDVTGFCCPLSSDGLLFDDVMFDCDGAAVVLSYVVVTLGSTWRI